MRERERESEVSLSISWLEWTQIRTQQKKHECMAQHRQLGAERFSTRVQDPHHTANGSAPAASYAPDQISVHIPHKQPRLRRLARSDKSRKVPLTSTALLISLVFVATFFAFVSFTRDREYKGSENDEDDDHKIDTDFLSNVTRKKGQKLHFGHGSVSIGRDSRYWDKDDRRRDDEYDGEELELSSADNVNDSGTREHKLQEKTSESESSLHVQGHRKANVKPGGNQRSVGLYNEAGRDELKQYEAEYEASLKSVGQSSEKNKDKLGLSDGENAELQDEDANQKDYDDGIDFDDFPMDELEETKHDRVTTKSETGGIAFDDKPFDDFNHSKNSNSVKEVEVTNEIADTTESRSSLPFQSSRDVQHKIKRGNFFGKTIKESSTLKKTDSRRIKRHKLSGSPCEMKFLNSTAQLIEPWESRKFSRFTLQYTEVEERPIGFEEWEPRFAGHQTLQEREESFYARDQKINCGFVRGPKGSRSTGFDLSEDDARYMSSCHITVSSCIFGNSDRLRTPTNKAVTRLSRKNVCFVMFVDESTLQTLSLEGQKPDNMGFIGLWKIVVVKNLPFDDMRRVGKIPKFLTHRLFPSARYSIWLDSKLRLQSDPYVILEYFLWRRSYEYAISNHYARHCVWEEVAQNKKLNKFNHTIIDQQFEFYQKDGLQRFNVSDPNKLLPSYVPEGSFIVRAHTPMSNLFSCLWFNEVDRFTPRDQLSFAHTFLKLTRMNPGKPFRLNMFKDCERRLIAKLFHHRAEEKRNVLMQAQE